jgi:hypothetical protein
MYLYNQQLPACKYYLILSIGKLSQRIEKANLSLMYTQVPKYFFAIEFPREFFGYTWGYH